MAKQKKLPGTIEWALADGYKQLSDKIRADIFKYKEARRHEFDDQPDTCVQVIQGHAPFYTCRVD
jgi:hypothetical protein